MVFRSGAPFDRMNNRSPRLVSTCASATDKDGCDVDGIHWAHPFLGGLRFHQWVAFVGLHEQRHAAQVAATGKQLQG